MTAGSWTPFTPSSERLPCPRALPPRWGCRRRPGRGRSHHRELAAVDDQRGTVDERGVVGGEERVGGRDLFGFAGPPERYPLSRVGRFELGPTGRGGHSLVQRGADIPGAQR